MGQEIFDLKLKGYCCSQIIMQMGLARMEKVNEDLVAAMAGLCDGLWQGKVCGTLSAAICLLYLADPYESGKAHARDMYEWFEDAFGAVDCDDILEGKPLMKTQKCPMIVESAFTKIMELLEWD